METALKKGILGGGARAELSRLKLCPVPSPRIEYYFVRCVTKTNIACISYNPRQKSWHACTLFQYLSRQFIRSAPPPHPNSMLFIVMKIVIARFQHCQGGRGFLIPVMPLVIVSKIAYQRMFQLSDPGVPRNFVEDCSYISYISVHVTF